VVLQEENRVFSKKRELILEKFSKLNHTSRPSSLSRKVNSCPYVTSSLNNQGAAPSLPQFNDKSGRESPP
jgi:hypothetical protein